MREQVCQCEYNFDHKVQIIKPQDTNLFNSNISSFPNFSIIKLGLNQTKSVAELSSKVWGNRLQICWGTVSKTGVLSGKWLDTGWNRMSSVYFDGRMFTGIRMCIRCEDVLNHF